MSKRKVFEFDNIDLFLNDENNFVFETVRGGVCVFDPIRNIFLYDDMDKYNRIFVDCWLDDNDDIISNWESVSKTGDYNFRDTR